MTWEIALVLMLLAAAVAAFAGEWMSVDIVTLLLLSALMVSNILTPQEAFSGFASDVIVIICSIFVLSKALIKTGVMDSVAALMAKIGGGSRTRMLLTVMSSTASTSAFMNNTTATAVFMPGVLGLCRKSGFSPAQMLIPLSFASILGGTCSLIGTSTNVAVSGFVERAGMEPFALFEFAPVGISIVVSGMLFMIFAGWRLLPPGSEESFTEQYRIREYLSEITLGEGGELIGETIKASRLTDIGVTVLEVVRGNEKYFASPHTRFEEGDLLIVKGGRDGMLRLQEMQGIEIHAARLDDADLITDEIMIGEAVLGPQSSLTGKTLTELNFRGRFGVTALAVHRRGHAVPRGVRRLRLRVGDVLLLQGDRDAFREIVDRDDLWLLEQSEHVPHLRRRGGYVLAVFLATVTLGGAGVLPLSAAFLLAAIASVLLRCVRIEEAYQFIDWRLVILIGGMTSFGVAMEKTQAADLVAGWLATWTLPMGPIFVLGAFAAATMLLTQPMSNAAAALVMLPIALTAAESIDANPRTFAAMIALSASVSFITPFEPSSLLVYSAAKYRFRDFVKVGLPLTVLELAVLMALVPMVWPL